jgi:hypothetical protein
MTDNAIGRITSCAGKQTDVTQITVTDVIVMQTTGSFTDAGRGERKAITQAALTLTRSNLTRTQRYHLLTEIGMTGAKIMKPRL